MAASIKIAPSPVMIRVDEGETTGVARVSYRATDFEPFVWERRLGAHWERAVDASPSDPSGDWPIELELGEIYQVLMYDSENADPNVAIDDPAPEARTSTAGLAKRTPAELITSEEFGAGGTFFGWSPQTTVRTRAVMQVGRDEPETTEDGVHDLRNPLGTVEEGLAESHSLQFASVSLLPGNVFWATLLLLGEDGTWQSRKEQFTTKKRSIEIDLRQIHIINDGSPGHNRASFRLWVCEGNTFRSACELNEREITDRPSPDEIHMEYIALSADCERIKIRPAAVTKDRQRVAVLTRGIAKSTIGTDDISGNFKPTNQFPENPPFEEDIQQDAFLHLPVGDGERVDDDPFSTYADPLNNPGSNEFMYNVIGRYSVTYE